MRLSINKNILSYLLTVFALAILYFEIDKASLKLLLNVKPVDIFISVLLAFVLYITSGFEYYLIRKQFGVSLQLKDIFLLPIVGNLWSFIFPFQGNMLFITLFFKRKYNMSISESFSISIYLYLVTLCFTGLFGLFFAYYYNILISWFALLSLIFLLNPIFVFLADKYFHVVRPTRYSFLSKMHSFVSSIVENTGKLWKNPQFTLVIFLINLCRIFFSIMWYYWISRALGYNLSFIAIGLISLVISVSIIIKITPDNLGFTQLIAGGLMGMVGASPDQAVLITLFASATTMILIFTIGVWGNFYYFKTINFIYLVKSEQ